MSGNSRRRPRRRLRLLLVGTLLVLLLGSGLFFQHYGGAPATAKDCVVQVAPAPSPSGPAEVLSGYPRWLDQERGTVNDASCLNRTPVYGVTRPGSEEEVRRALHFARSQGLAVSVSGTRHSMGGQAAFPNGLVLDMRAMDRVVVDQNSRTARVGAGATWRDVLETSHKHGLSVAAMPSIDVLSVGGTLSANAHGADFRTGSLASTVRSLTLMTADGATRVVDRAADPELFGAVIGGYGLFGVILEAELELDPAVEGEVTIELRDVSLATSLEAVCEMLECSYAYDQGPPRRLIVGKGWVTTATKKKPSFGDLDTGRGARCAGEAQRCLRRPALDQGHGERGGKRIAGARRVDRPDARRRHPRDVFAPAGEYGSRCAECRRDEALAGIERRTVPGRLGFVDDYEVGALQHADIDLFGGREIDAEEAFECRRGPGDGVRRNLELADQRIRGRQGQFLGVETPVRTGCDDDLVLAGAGDVDQRDARGCVVDRHDAAEIDAGFPQQGERRFRFGVPADAADHLHLCAEAARRECLVRALAAGETPQFGVRDRLPRDREALRSGDDIEVDRADDDDRWHGIQSPKRASRSTSRS